MTEEIINTTNQDPETDYNFQSEEFNRLTDLRNESENLWENRTYRLAAGGLCLTFVTTLFMIARDESIDFVISIIFSVYAICLLINYVSQRISLNNLDKYLTLISDDIREGKPYDDVELNERYKSGNKRIGLMNYITECLLFVNIILSVMYFVILFI